MIVEIITKMENYFYRFRAATFYFFRSSKMSKRPVEVEAQQGEPREHGEATEVEDVAEGEASRHRERK